jgi:predicted O-linked N-acetylglucosamine transferase (SPINDLY family)
MRTRPEKVAQSFQQAVSLHDQGHWREAERLYQKILASDDCHFGSLCRLGLLRLRLSRFGEAEQLFRRALKADGRSADAHQLLGFALTGLARFDEAVRSYEQAIAIRPAFAEAHNNLGYALQVWGRLDEAIARYKQAVAIRPDYQEAHNNLGNALHLLDRSAEAIVCYEKALSINPNYAEAYWNLGTASRAVGKLEDAVENYKRAIAIRPSYQEAYNSLGNTLRALGRLGDAIAQYRKALDLNRTYIEAWINLGDALAAQHQDDAALEAFAGALVLRPNDPDILAKRGHLLVRLQRELEALASFDAALVVAPGHDLAFDGLASCALATCDWPRAATLWSEVPARVAKGHLFNPLTFLGYSSDAALQLACARRFIRSEVPVSPPRLWRGETWRNSKIKIAYVATGFHRHPTAYLTAELIEIHDRSYFEILGISLGPDDESEIRARLVRAFDQFHDVRYKGDREISMLLNEWRVDIAVDRSGYTANARPGIFAARPAPIQVNYIGFPGTLGADFYDYILADPTVLPFDQQPYFQENIVHLPESYLVNDSKRPASSQSPTREEYGLPATGFVFCCFNNCYKITPPVFDVWMRLLDQVEGSVLWLFRDRRTAEANLRREAAARGIDPARLVFADRIPLPDHMARHKIADLFLDTLPYNAHTTAADALWAGLPVVTCLGHCFAGRVAASLLRATGMSDLVTSDLESYERLALRIASDRAMLAELRDRLRRNRQTHALFNADRYRRQIEAAYQQMWEAWQRGEPPASFTIEHASKTEGRPDGSGTD